MITNKAIMAAYRKANNIPDSAPLFTFAVWKRMGYNVKRGERCKHVVNLYKYCKVKDKDGNYTGKKCLFVPVYLFEEGQVQRSR